MKMVVVLSSNIYDEDGEKQFRGAAFEASDDFVKMVLDGDEEAGREPRLTVVNPPKRGRPKNGATDETE